MTDAARSAAAHAEALDAFMRDLPEGILALTFITTSTGKTVVLANAPPEAFKAAVATWLFRLAGIEDVSPEDVH